MTKQPGSAIVVGGGSGIGRATVLALAAAGTRVWAVGRDRARLEQMLAALGLAEVEHNAKNNRMRAAGRSSIESTAAAPGAAVERARAHIELGFLEAGGVGERATVRRVTPTTSTPCSGARSLASAVGAIPI